MTTPTVNRSRGGAVATCPTAAGSGLRRQRHSLDVSFPAPFPDWKIFSPRTTAVKTQGVLRGGLVWRQRWSSGRTAVPSRATPVPSVRPCGVPKSTRPAPASRTRCASAATCSGVPENANRSRTSSGISAPAASSAGRDQVPDLVGESGRQFGGGVQFGHDRQVLGHLGPGQAARGGAVLVHHGDGAEHDLDLPTGVGRPGSRPRTRSRISGTTAGLALPPTLTSSAISPASAAPRGPHAPTSSGGTAVGKRVAQPGAGGEPVRRPA